MSERGAATATATATATAATMVSDQTIAESLETLLRETNPRTPLTSFNSVVHHLESKLGIDLTHKLDFIRNQIHLLFNPSPNPNPPPPPPSHYHQQPHLQQPQQQNPNFHAAQPQNPNFRPQQPPLVKAETEPGVSDVAASGAATGLAESPKERSCKHLLNFISNPKLIGHQLARNGEGTTGINSPTGRKRRGGPGGLNKVCGVTPELQAIVGHPELPRTEIVKQLWAYIRKHNLQDPGNKRKIICNDELRLVFETDCTDMFKMNKLLSKHIIPLEPTKPPKKPKMEVESGTKSTESGPVVIVSEALASFFGIARREMLHSEVLSRVWEYVTVHHLEDPVNPMVVQCDAKLQELFGCASISAMGIPEMLARHHLFKRS